MIESHPLPLRDPDALWNHLRERAEPEGEEALFAAYRIAARAHKGQSRRARADGERVPYLTHPLRVALILTDEWDRRDAKTLATALLHDVIEDALPEFQQEIEAAMGKEISNAVWTLTKPRLPQPCPEDTRAARDARYFSALRHAAEWIRLVKCADRVDNLRDARALGDPGFWARYSSETIGWHLVLARETAPIAEVALFKAIVEGERDIRGRVPVWADGRLIDPIAAAAIPEHVARLNNVIGLALRGDTLLVGALDPTRSGVAQTLGIITHKKIELVPITPDALRDAQTANLYGTVTGA